MKFVYFDVCSVLLNDSVDTNEGWNFFMDSLGLKVEGKKKFNDFWEVFGEKLEIGENIENFPLELKNNFKIDLPKKYSINNDLINKFFFRNDGIWKIVEDVKTKYEVGLLTNMYEGMLDLIRKRELIPNMGWDVIMDSSIEKCRKPDKKIYEIAQKRTGVEAKEILFIDNKQENLEIPQKMGWQTYWYDSGDYEKSNWKLAQYLR